MTQNVPISSINLEPEKKSDIDINLDDLFKDDPPNKSQNILDDINLDGYKINSDQSKVPTSPKPVEKTYEELQKDKAEYIRLLERLEHKGIHSHKKF